MDLRETSVMTVRVLLNLLAEIGEAAHCGHDDDEDDDAAAAGGVCWPEPSLSVWLAAVLSSAWVWFLQSGVPLAGN